MSMSRQKWVRSLQSSSLLRTPPQNAHQRQTEIVAYIELFGQFASESFGDDIGELVRSHYPHQEVSLVDDVLASFILYHPEHGHAILHALLSCIIDGTLVYSKTAPPFGSFVSLFSRSSEKDFSEQWALACGETLRVLTHYNRPIYLAGSSQVGLRPDKLSDGATCSSNTRGIPDSGIQNITVFLEQDKRTPTRLLTPWITDSLLAAPLGIKSDYFRWCGGVMGKYAAGGELKPPSTVGNRGPGKHPQLMPSTPRWAVANGASVILSVCDYEVSQYETADLTAAAVPALLLPPPTTANDEHLVAGLPPLEPYARLFHRYYVIATPSATQQLLLGLLEAPPSWAPDALDAAVQLVELLRAAEDYSSSMELPKNWLYLHFLRPVGASMAMKSRIAADAAAALLFRVFSQPALLFPPPGHAQGVSVRQSLHGPCGLSWEQMEMAETETGGKATAQGLASLLCDHGPDVEWRICALWEAAYGLLPLDSSTVDLPEFVVATPIQPPALSWNLYRPLLQVLEYLPRGSPSEACLLKIFTATVESMLHRNFPLDEILEKRNGSTRASQMNLGGTGSKNLAIAELRTMVHSLFTDGCPSPDLAARLLSMAVTVCLSHDAVQRGNGKFSSEIFGKSSSLEEETQGARGRQRFCRRRLCKDRGAAASFDSYIVAAVCALACEMQLHCLSPPLVSVATRVSSQCIRPQVGVMHITKSSNGYESDVFSAINHARRVLSLLEALLALVPSTSCTVPGTSNIGSGEILAAAVVAAHISELLGRSRACMHALASIIRYKWDPSLSDKATSVLALVERNEKAVAAVADATTASKLSAVCVKEGTPEQMELDTIALAHEARIHTQSAASQTQNASNEQTIHVCNNCDREFVGADSREEEANNSILRGYNKNTLANFPINVSDLASLLCVEKHNGMNGNIDTLVKAVLIGKEDLSVAAVPLLWQRLIFSPEPPTTGEGTSAKRGWRQVLEALCNIVSVFPLKAISAIILQAERDLQPWVDNEGVQGLQNIWQINKRIVSLLTELLRLHVVPEAMKVVASALNLLHRATDGMAIDGEACALPQLELLEAAAAAAQVLSVSDGSCETVINVLSTLLKNRLPAIVQCLSHSSAHVRALSMALLRDVVHAEPLRSRYPKGDEFCNADHACADRLNDDWIKSVKECVAWEIHKMRAMGMPISMLINAADSLGCSVPI